MSNTRPSHDSTSVGDPSRFLTLAALQGAFAGMPTPSADTGRLALIVRRVERGLREILPSSVLTRESGLPGDAWSRDPSSDAASQLTLMDVGVATLIANGQSLELFGDQLFVSLDLSTRNLPIGSTIRIGGAVVEVTPEPHNGCAKFRARFGPDALRFVSMGELRHHNFRGIYVTVVEDGEVMAGDVVSVVSRRLPDC